MSINLLDILILIPLLLFAWQGYRKGFIIEVATLIALLLGIYFALHFSDYAASLLTQHFTIDEKYLAVISFIVTFIVVVIVVIAVGKIVQKFIDLLLLGFLNKLEGAVFGALKGALLISILLVIINYFDTGSSLIKEEQKQQSVLYQPVASFAPWLYSWLELKNFDIKIPKKEDLIKSI
jgi:membrane protein required for colicin V production